MLQLKHGRHICQRTLIWCFILLVSSSSSSSSSYLFLGGLTSTSFLFTSQCFLLTLSILEPCSSSIHWPNLYAVLEIFLSWLPLAFISCCIFLWWYDIAAPRWHRTVLFQKTMLWTHCSVYSSKTESIPAEIKHILVALRWYGDLWRQKNKLAMQFQCCLCSRCLLCAAYTVCSGCSCTLCWLAN